jgi:hypothetical protein
MSASPVSSPDTLSAERGQGVSVADLISGWLNKFEALCEVSYYAHDDNGVAAIAARVRQRNFLAAKMAEAFVDLEMARGDVADLRIEGGQLANCAFNLSQSKELAPDPATRKTLAACYRRWDEVIGRQNSRRALLSERPTLGTSDLAARSGIASGESRVSLGPLAADEATPDDERAEPDVMIGHLPGYKLREGESSHDFAKRLVAALEPPTRERTTEERLAAAYEKIGALTAQLRTARSDLATARADREILVTKFAELRVWIDELFAARAASPEPIRPAGDNT